MKKGMAIHFTTDHTDFNGFHGEYHCVLADLQLAQRVGAPILITLSVKQPAGNQEGMIQAALGFAIDRGRLPADECDQAFGVGRCGRVGWRGHLRVITIIEFPLRCRYLEPDKPRGRTAGGNQIAGDHRLSEAIGVVGERENSDPVRLAKDSLESGPAWQGFSRINSGTTIVPESGGMENRQFPCGDRID